MAGVIRPTSNTVNLGSATNVFKSTAVRVVNSGTTARTITGANTAAPQNGGGDYRTGPTGVGQAEVYLHAALGAEAIIIKKPTDTLDASSAEVIAHGVSQVGG